MAARKRTTSSPEEQNIIPNKKQIRSLSDCTGWDVEDVCGFFEENGLAEVVPVIRQQELTGAVLSNVTKEDLEKIGINKLGTRLRIMQLLGQLKHNQDGNNPLKVETSLHLQLKIFNDPIHGHIELHPLCVKIVDTPQFQRLRYILQLGASYWVFPGATHKRFEHCIGVCHLAGQLTRALQYRQPELGITDKDVLCVQIAGLCHDLGHGPLSHFYDGLFIPKVGKGTDWKHEVASVNMFQYLIDDNDLFGDFEDYGLDELDIEFIKEQIAGPITTEDNRNYQGTWNYKGRQQEKSFLYEVVANKRNGIDVDKWDYFARDCHQLGIQNNFDHDRFMKFARVIRVEGELQICSRDKEVGNLYDFFHTRACLHRRAYQHKTTKIVERMICEALEKADSHIKITGKNGHKHQISTAIDDMVAYSKLTDSVINQIMYSEDQHSDMKKAREILLKIDRRQLYKCVGQTMVHREDNTLLKDDIPKYEQGIIDCIDSSSGSDRRNALTKDDIVLDFMYFDYGMKTRNPIDHVRFYQKGNPEVAIRVRKEQVSQMLPDIFREQLVRLYCKKTDAHSLDLATAAFYKWCILKKLTPPKGGDVASMELTPLKQPETPIKSRNGAVKRLERPNKSLPF